MTPKVGIAISTLNRREVFLHTLAEYQRFTPPEFPLIVVDDGSDVPVPKMPSVKVIRHYTPKGVARTKNRSIVALMDAGVDHLILSDDDVFPTDHGWWEPYVNSGEHHLSLQLRWQGRCLKCGQTTHWSYNTVKGYPTCDVCHPGQAIYDDGTIHAVEWGSGVILYATRHAIDTVGGMRPEFRRWSGDHWEWAYRMRNAGLVRYPFQDVNGTPKLYAIDAHSTAQCSSVSREVRDAHRDRNWQLFLKFKDTVDFVEYREQELTDLVTVCIPRRDTPNRVDAHNRCRQFWVDNGFTVVSADSDKRRPFLCSQARNNAVKKAKTSIVVVADADTIPDDIGQIQAAVDMVASGQADVVYPFVTYLHIDKAWALKPGDEFKVAPIQQRYDNSPGGIFVMSKDTHARLGGFDERFQAGVSDSGSCFGFDDTAFRLAAKTLGTVGRTHGRVWSFNHATNAAGLPDRDFGMDNPNRARYMLYEFAQGDPSKMAELVRQ